MCMCVIIMESGSVLSEQLNSSVYRKFPTAARSASVTIISPNRISSVGQPRMSELENLEAKMANIEVSLSSSNLIGKRRKGTSLGGTISARSSPRPESKELRSALQDREAVIQNLRIQLCLGKLPRPTGPPLDESEKPAAEQKLQRLKTDAENKRIAIRNLKSTLDKLDITDNIDTRIRQAELEYALGREELQLLSIVEEARALQARLDKSKPESNTIFSMLTSGVNLSLHAVQATIGRWAAHQKPDCPGFYVEWALDGEGLFRGDRIIEVNGKIANFRTREDLQKNIGTGGKCQLVVLRKRTTTIPHQQLVQQQEDNLRLQHRISYLEEQVRELQTSNNNKEALCTPQSSSAPTTDATHNNGASSLLSSSTALSSSAHVTSISISSPPSTPPEKPQIFQRGNYVTTLIGGKPIEFAGNSKSSKSHITKTIIKENSGGGGSLTDSENCNYLIPITKSLSASKVSINSEQALLSTSSSHNCHKRDRDRHRERQPNEKTLTRGGHTKLNDVIHHHHHHHQNNSNNNNNNQLFASHHRNYSHARSVEHLNYNGERRKGSDLQIIPSSSSSTSLSYDHQIRKCTPLAKNNDLRSVKSLDFDSDVNNEKKRSIDYTSEPVAHYHHNHNLSKIRPTPPKKPLRLSLQRAQSLQTVELINTPSSLSLATTTATLADLLDKKRCLKRTHNSDTNNKLMGSSSASIIKSIENYSNINNGTISSSSSCNNVPLHTASLGRQKHV